MTAEDRVAVAERDRDDRERQRRQETVPAPGAPLPVQVAVPVPTGRGAHDAGRVMVRAGRPPATPPPLDAVARWEERAGGPTPAAEQVPARRHKGEVRRREIGREAERTPVVVATPVAAVATSVSSPTDVREVAARRAAERAGQPARAPPTRLVQDQTSGRGPPTGPLARPDVPSAVRRVVAAPGPGAPVADPVARQVEPLLGADVSGVRVHQDRRTEQAARDLDARAFTVGTHVFLGAGQSATDVPLLAHELTHAVQPGTAGIVHRDLLGIDTAARDAIGEQADSVPGYTLLTLLVRYDPIRGRRVEPTPERVVRGVVGLVPYGTAIYDRLAAGDLVQRVLDLVTGGLLAHNLTLARLQREIDAAWDEIHLVDGLTANLAVIARHVGAVARDVTAFAGELVDGILALVRELAVGMVEPLLTGPTVGPVWDVAKKVLHRDPLRGTPVVATTEEILEDLLRLLGQGDKIEQLRERGVITQVAAWIDANVGRVLSLVDDLGALFREAWQAIQPSNIADLPNALDRLVTHAGELLGRVRTFAEELIAQALSLVKDSLLHWLSEHAHHARGFRLVTVLIGKDPFTQEVVPLTPANLIGGFITLLPDGENTFHQLEESGVIAEAAGRIETAAATLGISWSMITGTFRGIWDSLHLEDLLHPLDTFERIVGAFGEPLGRIISFVSTVVQVVIELILRLMNFPSDLLASIIEHVTSAIDAIQADPVRFLLNMLEALKRGFLSFVDHIVTHLLNGLSAWLFRGLRQMGITPPTEVSVESIITLVLQVLGLSMDLVWAKLEERLGAETVGRIRGAISMLSGAWTFLKDVQERGMTAIWEFIQGQLSNLWDTIISAAQTWIQERIVSAVVEKLISMLDPTGVMAVVNSFLAFFRAVQSLIDYIREVLEVVNEYVTTLDEVAHGNVDPAAQKVEHGLAMAVPMAIGFLANQVGIGNIPEKIVEIVQSIRGVVEQAVSWLIDQAITLGRSALAALGVGGARPGEPAAGADEGGPKARAQARLRAALAAHPESIDQLRTELTGISQELRAAGLTGLELRGPNADGSYHVFGSASPWTEIAALMPGFVASRQAVLRISLTVEGSTAGASGTSTARQLARDSAGDPIRDASGGLAMQDRTLLDPLQPPRRAFTTRQDDPRRRPGGIVAQPSEPQRIELLTWNTGELRGSPNERTNDTHAERQFLAYLQRNRGPGGIAGRVTAIDASINLSPCRLCSTSLAEAAELTPGAANHRHLTWNDLYVSPTIGTTTASLQIGGWTVSEPSVTPAAEARAAAGMALLPEQWPHVLEEQVHPAPVPAH
ncbi:eCIS core domain-containing protein [Cellulomonas sp. ICMP 17802]|uniref:eCIS core domain-containing protein n=1 Tax=Cellulomonas sp. ICMP 17802 TaxID=3239199 RepID=UPI00351B4813